MWLNIIQFRIETNILRFEHSIPIILGMGRSGRMILSVCVFNAASRQCVCVCVCVCVFSAAARQDNCETRPVAVSKSARLTGLSCQP